MAFRINKGIFQFSDGTKFINKFKIDDNSGELVEVDPETGDPVDGYLRTSGKAADADKLDGLDSGAFLRSNANDTFTGTITMGTQVALVANNYGRGVFGTYSSTRYQHLWGMGSAYKLADNGTSTGNFYGVAWTHQNIGGESISGLGHQMLIMSNGDTRSAIGDGIWTKYNLEVGGTTYINNINTKNGSITNNKGSYLHLGGWAVGRTDASAVLVNTAYRSDILSYARTFTIGNTGKSFNGSANVSWTLAEIGAEASGTAQTLVDAAKEELLNGAISTAQTTADNAATAAATATNNANTALERADGTKLAVAELGNSLGTAAYTDSTAYLGATAKAVDSDKVDGYHASQLWRRTSGTNGTAGAGWMTVASAGDGGRWSGEVIVTDGESSDHSFIRIHWMRSYQDSNFVVLNCGGHSNRITGARVLYESSDNTYGKKYLQVYVTTSSNYYVRVTQEGDTPNFSTISAVTPVIENSKSGYAVHGAELTGLEHASLAAEEGIKVGGTIYTNSHGNSSNWNTAYNWGNHASAGYLASNGKAADADKLDGYDWMQSGKSVRANEFYADNWFRNYNSGEGLYNEATGAHIVSDANERWTIRDAGNTIAIRFATNGNTQRGMVYANSGNDIGFLDAGGSWAIKHTNDYGTRFYSDGATEEFKIGRDAVSGNYGTVQTSSTKGSWGGYSIAGRVVFMHDHSNGWGIYNDVNNEWMVYGSLNGSVQLRYNNATKIETNSGGVTVTGTVTATAFSGDGSGLTNIPIPAPSIPALIFGMENTEITSAEITDRGEMRFNLANGQAIYLDGIRPSIR